MRGGDSNGAEVARVGNVSRTAVTQTRCVKTVVNIAASRRSGRRVAVQASLRRMPEVENATHVRDVRLGMRVNQEMDRRG